MHHYHHYHLSRLFFLFLLFLLQFNNSQSAIEKKIPFLLSSPSAAEFISFSTPRVTRAAILAERIITNMLLLGGSTSSVVNEREKIFEQQQRSESLLLLESTSSFLRGPSKYTKAQFQKVMNAGEYLFAISFRS